MRNNALLGAGKNNHVPNLSPIDQLKNIHSHQHLRTHNQYISQRDRTSPRIGIVQHRIPKHNIDKRIDRRDQDDQLRHPSNMMIYETPSVDLIELGVSDAVKAFEQEGFDDELF